MKQAKEVIISSLCLKTNKRRIMNKKLGNSGPPLGIRGNGDWEILLPLHPYTPIPLYPY
jgi:hypothetical protein